MCNKRCKKMELTVSKHFEFEASHRLINKKLTDEENKKLFGKCYDCISHGHTYKLTVTVGGKVNENGMIINFHDLKGMVENLIINKVDHKFLNEEVDFLKDKITTCENMITEFWNILDKHLKENFADINLKKIQLYETSDSYATMENK